MKTTYKIIAVSALALAIALPALAQTDDNNTSVDSDTSVNASVQMGMPVPPPFMGEGQSEPGRPSIRAALRADINSRVENAQNNQDIRNMLERRMGTSTAGRPIPKMMRDDQDGEDNASDTPDREDNRRGPRPFMASTSMMMGSTTWGGRFGDNGDEDHMRKDMFENRKRIVTKELDVAINNLNNISIRLSSRIAKEAATGRDMSTASSSLVTANAKIKIAADAVTALEAYLPSASSTASASTTVNLDTARNLAKTAQQDIKDARQALNDVVVAIAHSLGLRLGDDRDNSGPEATSTASTTTQ